MTMLTIDTQDSRTAKALEIAVNAGQWIKVRGKDGQPFAFGVPSQTEPGRYYLVNTRQCECNDFRRRGQPCKHITAVVLHVAIKRAEKARPARRTRGTAACVAATARYDDIFKRFAGE
jgi:hypothetical protein